MADKEWYEWLSGGEAMSAEEYDALVNCMLPKTDYFAQEAQEAAIPADEYELIFERYAA